MNLTKNYFKRTLCVVLLVAIILSVFPVFASADIGPKASVVINFNGLPNEPCYATLISEQKSTGPASAWDGEEKHINDNGNREIWQKFVDYVDADGYYFLQQFGEVSGSGRFTWGYYPPQHFKVLIYFPESDVFAVTRPLERYAFDTYYTLTYDSTGAYADQLFAEYDTVNSTDERYNEYKTQIFLMELSALLGRALCCIAVEIAVALLFGFRKGKALGIIVLVNVITQLILNVGLVLLSGSLDYTGIYIAYALLELAIFVGEGYAYSKLLPKYCEAERGKRFYFLYALVANGASLLLGFALAEILPGLF